MDYIKIIDYRGIELKVKRPGDKKYRSDKKYTIKSVLSEREKRLVNIVMYKQGYSYVVDFVTDAIANGIHLAITSDDISATKRKLRDQDGIQVAARLDAELYDKFCLLKAKANLSQRALTLVLIKKACEMAGYQWK